MLTNFYWPTYSVGGGADTNGRWCQLLSVVVVCNTPRHNVTHQEAVVLCPVRVTTFQNYFTGGLVRKFALKVFIKYLTKLNVLLCYVVNVNIRKLAIV